MMFLLIYLLIGLVMAISSIVYSFKTEPNQNDSADVIVPVFYAILFAWPLVFLIAFPLLLKDLVIYLNERAEKKAKLKAEASYRVGAK